MPDPIGSLIRRAALTSCFTVVAVARAGAQQPLAEPPSSGQFLSRFDFHLSAAGLAVDDPRFKVDTHWGGDWDLVDYVYGRLMFLADYEAVLGDQFRLFDPNQGNYTLEVSSSFRAGGAEFAGVLHHVSRHLGDRANRLAIAMNVAVIAKSMPKRRGSPIVGPSSMPTTVAAFQRTYNDTANVT